MRQKLLQELTIKDNFMFAAVMSRPENCKSFLEVVLGFEIAKVEVDYEKTVIYNPLYHGIRLDIYAKDKNNTRYNIEMQGKRKCFWSPILSLIRSSGL